MVLTQHKAMFDCRPWMNVGLSAAMNPGISKRPLWSAENWALSLPWRRPGRAILEPIRDGSSSEQCAAVVPKGICWSALTQSWTRILAKTLWPALDVARSRLLLLVGVAS